MVVTHNEIINAIVLAENVAYLNAQARAIALENGETPCAEDNAKAIEIEQWITILQRAEAQVENGCITSDDVWQLIQSINEQYRDVDCDVSRTFSRNSSSGGGVNPPSGYVERVLGVNVDNSNPSRPVVRIYVDGITITGNGTEANPFVAVGGGGGTVVSVNGQTGVVTLTTTNISEGTRLYFTTARVLATALSGLSITGGAITSSDTVLQAFGKLQSQLNLLVGGVTYQGTWNASTNSPLLTSSVGTKGYYYVVSVAGTTSLNGINDWQVGDWAIFNGSIWQKVDNTNSQTLAQTLIAGNTSGANDIEFDATQGLLFANASRLREGTIDAGLGGLKGIAQICAVGYELKWEAGRLYVMDGNGLFIRQSLYNFTTTPTATDDTDKGYMVGSLWTLDDGTTYVCTVSTIGNAVWVEVGLTAGILEITVGALQTLESNGELSLTTIYIITDSTPYKLMCKAETVSQLSRTATIVDAVYSGQVYYDLEFDTISNGTIYDADGNTWNGCLPNIITLGTGCLNNQFNALSIGNSMGENCSRNIFTSTNRDIALGVGCINNTFGQGSESFKFGDNLQNVTIEAGISGDNYNTSPDYDFLYNNTYASTIFTDGTNNYHRYYDPANDRIVLRNLSTPLAAPTYIGSGGGTTLDLEVNGTPNGDQTLLNLIEGINIDITDNGTGGVTITSLADRYSTTSVTSNTISNGAKTFTVDANLAYIPLQEVLIVYNPSNHMHATVTSYSGTTLVVNVTSHTGSGTYTSWVLNLDGVPVDAITGAGVSNQLAYFTGGQVITSLAAGTNGQVLGLSGGLPTWSTSKGAFGVTFDGQGGVVSVGKTDWVFIPYNCTITGWDITGDQVGSCVIDIWKDTYANFPPTAADSIAGSEKPTLASARKNRDLALSPPWAAVTAGDCIMFYVDSCSTLTKINLIVYTNIII